MRRILTLLLILFFLTLPVSATEFSAPAAPERVEDLMPVQTESFSSGLLKILKGAFADLHPDIVGAARICVSLVAVMMLLAILKELPGGRGQMVEFAGVIAVGGLLLNNTSAMIHLGADTVKELSDYGKLLLPVMTAAMAAQGGTASSAALYTATAAFDAILSAFISNILVPMVYIFLVLSIASCAMTEQMLDKLRDFVKWLATWCLKTVMYIFTGYMGITGVVSGAADAAAVKATKLTIAGMVPVVGSILSDASEAVIVGAGVMKSAVGIYGLFAIASIWIGPFLKIGAQYLLLKLTAAVCEVFGVKRVCSLIRSFSGAMGLLLGMTGTVCFLLLISTVCLMKGVS